MSLKDRDRVDVVVRSKRTGGFDLIAFDRGDITDQTERHNLMIAKLTAYAQYVASGDFLEGTPEARGCAVRFCVVCTTAPNEAMLSVEGIKLRQDPAVTIPVVVSTEQDYIAAEGQ